MRKEEALNKFYDLLSDEEKKNLLADPENFYYDIHGMNIDSEDFLDNDIIRYDIYTDGSYREGQPVSGWAYAIFNGNGKYVSSNSGVIDDSKWLKTRNVGGEIQAVKAALRDAVYLKRANEVTIHHDYEGVSKWVSGEWQTKQDITKGYVSDVNEIARDIDLKFEHVKAHSRVYGNELVDGFAKQAIEKFQNASSLSEKIDDIIKTSNILKNDSTYNAFYASDIDYNVGIIASQWRHEEEILGEKDKTALKIMSEACLTDDKSFKDMFRNSVSNIKNTINRLEESSSEDSLDKDSLELR